VDRDDLVAALEQRLIDGEKVSDRRLRGGWQLTRAAELFVVRVVIGDLDLGRRLAVPVHIQTDLTDVVLLEQLAREVVACVRDDRDGHESRHPTSADAAF